MAVGLSVMGAPSSGASRSPLPAAGTEAAAEYVVQPGETLWSIAGSSLPMLIVTSPSISCAANAGSELQVVSGWSFRLVLMTFGPHVAEEEAVVLLPRVAKRSGTSDGSGWCMMRAELPLARAGATVRHSSSISPSAVS